MPCRDIRPSERVYRTSTRLHPDHHCIVVVGLGSAESDRKLFADLADRCVGMLQVSMRGAQLPTLPMLVHRTSRLVPGMAPQSQRRLQPRRQPLPPPPGLRQLS